MTTLTFPVRLQRPFRLKGAREFVSALFAGIREGRDIAGRYDRLSRLSDAQLARLGLSRDQVPQAAVAGREAA